VNETAARRRWRGIAQVIAIIAIAAGVAVAVYADWATIASGAADLAHLRPGRVGLAMLVEAASMVAFALLNKGLLRKCGVTSAQITVRSVLATAYRANAIAVTVPVVGSAMATGYTYREFRRRGGDPARVSVALTVAGIFSTVAFAVLAAAGSVVTGNVAAAVLTAAGGLAAGAAAGAVLLSLRSPRARARLARLAVAVLAVSKRAARWPRGEPAELVAGWLDRAGSVRIGYRAGWRAFGYALANWLADVACLAFAISAVHASVPWRVLLLVWSAGAGAASLCPVPAGLGVVDIVLITTLTAAGLPAPQAVAAVLVYRIISFKILTTLVVSARPLVARRHHRGTTAAARRAAASGRPASPVGWGNGIRRMAA
jgi:putative heme transporter